MVGTCEKITKADLGFWGSKILRFLLRKDHSMTIERYSLNLGAN